MGKTEKKEMISRLSYSEKQGVKMYLDGKLSSSEKIADVCCVKEKGIYMPDYVISEKGELKEVRYDQIKQM